MEKQSTRDPRKLRNLIQYKNMSDEEFAEAMDTLSEDWLERTTKEQTETFDLRVKETLQEFENDYDLSDMKFNDRITLEALSRAYVTLKDNDNLIVKLRGVNLKEDGWALTLIDKLSKMASDLRRDISKMEDDLKISRKIRKNTGEENARAELDRQKKAAAKFYQQVMSYVYCPKCLMLLGTIWTLYPQQDNTFSFVCNRQLDETGEKFCGHKFSVTTKELMELEGTNHPEGFKF